MTASWLDNLFDCLLPAYRTQAAGITNAKFQQFTGLAEHVYRKILKILDDCGVTYYVFAGTMIGYVRNGQMPDWIDDIDVLIFEEEIENFKANALPRLTAAGLHCPVPQNFPGGGYHVVALWEPKNWHATVPLGDAGNVRIPLAQIDVFFTTVTPEGLLRNPVGWGDYHRHDIPVEWVKPGRHIDLFGHQVRVFQKYEDDVQKEYGDVMNNIIVGTHGQLFLRLTDTSWQSFSEIYEAHVAKIPTLAQIAAPHAPRPGSRLVIDESISIDRLVAAITKHQAEELVLNDRCAAFWAIDLKTVFPALQIIAFAATDHQCARLAHLADFIDRIEVAELELKNRLEEYLSAFGSGTPVTVRRLR